MEYNPLENIPCEVDIKDFWEQYSKDKKSMNGYHYLLKTITSKIKWFIIGGFAGYQGDGFFLGKDNNELYYYLNVGYGSCSYCDALEACKTTKDYLQLREDMKRNIISFNSFNEFYRGIIAESP